MSEGLFSSVGLSVFAAFTCKISHGSKVLFIIAKIVETKPSACLEPFISKTSNYLHFPFIPQQKTIQIFPFPDINSIRHYLLKLPNKKT